MTTAKRDLTDPRVQGHTLGLDEARQRLGGTRGDLQRFLLEHNVSYLQSRGEVEVDETEFEAALNGKGPLANSNGARSTAQEIVRRARSKQGLPPKINEPAVISRIVTLLQPNTDD